MMHYYDSGKPVNDPEVRVLASGYLFRERIGKPSRVELLIGDLELDGDCLQGRLKGDGEPIEVFGMWLGEDLDIFIGDEVDGADINLTLNESHSLIKRTWAGTYKGSDGYGHVLLTTILQDRYNS